MVDSRWIRNASDRLAVEAEGCTFDPRKGLLVCNFLEEICRQSKGDWAGELLKLMPWQKDFLMRLYGWRRPDPKLGTKRRFRTAYLEIPKKNGKSTMLSGLALYHLVLDGEQGAECVICAVDRSQARIIFDEAARMVDRSQELSEQIEVTRSTRTMVDTISNNNLTALSAGVSNKDGKNVAVCIFDELHRQPDDRLYEVFRYAKSSRRQPLHIDITTSGEDEKGIWFERRNYSEQVNEGVIPDTTHLGVIYRALPTDNLNDPTVWRKANPSLGVTIFEDDFQRDLTEAKASPRKWANFLRLRLGIVINETPRFLRAEDWAACAADLDESSLKDRPCYGGVDLSEIHDLSAWVLVFPDGKGGYDVLPRCWIPEESAALREREDNVPYRAWKERGFLEFTPGRTIDYSFIRAQVERDVELFDVRQVFVDPWNAEEFSRGLINDGIVPVQKLRQGFLSLTGATKELERLVLSGKLRHGNHPVLNWCASNAVVAKDAAGNIKLDKGKSTERIDLMAALVNAIAAAQAGGEDGASIYETRGLVFL